MENVPQEGLAEGVEDPGELAFNPVQGVSPGLSPVQLERLRRFGRVEDIAAGQMLRAAGTVADDLIVILSGQAEIVERLGDGSERLLARFGPSEFTGELGLLLGKRTSLDSVMRTPGQVLRVPFADLQTVMAQDVELSELILRAFLLRRDFLMRLGAGLTLVGSRFDPATRGLLEILARNRVPTRWLDIEHSPDAAALLERLDVGSDDLPLVLLAGGPVLRHPSRAELQGALGVPELHTTRRDTCDLLVVGGGPGGLAAAVYGASEGLSTALVESTALGGQAGTSSRIENYLGFPAGLSGVELATRALLQATKFGVRIESGARATSLRSADGAHWVGLDSGEVIGAQSLILATGAQYNRLDVENIDCFESVGVYYAATWMEATACAGGQVAIVGGGNSAGQAAVFLAQSCTSVHIVIRRTSLSDTMSRYLINEIEDDPRIHVHPECQVTGLIGDDQLEAVTLTARADLPATQLSVCGLFIFIGATPCTDWLGGQLAHDANGFLLTGADVPAHQRHVGQGTPLPLETSRAGIFCIGDARSGSVKRVATAVGEGSMAVRLVFDRRNTPPTA